MFTAMNTPIPTMSNLQKGANRCGKIMIAENLCDMERKKGKVKDILQYRGMARDMPINIEMDRQYNTPLSHARRKTPFAPASQSRDTVAENVTNEKYILAYNGTNKLCRLGQRMVSDGKKPLCPKHEGCSATISLSTNIGDEEDGGERCAKMLLAGSERITVAAVTTDSDGHFARGLRKVMKERAQVDPEPLLCNTHLNRSLARRLGKLALSKQAFPAKHVTGRQKLQRNFADDMAYRVQAELRAAKMKRDDITKVDFAKCVPAMLLCFTGNHELCHTDSYVCRGNFEFLYSSPRVRQTTNFTQHDRQQIHTAMMKRLRPSAVAQSRLLSTTQKSESMNAAFSTTNPKQIKTFTRNYAGRDHSAINLTNNGAGASILYKTAAANVPLSQSPRVIQQLKEMQKRRNYWRKRAKRIQVKASRAHHRRYKFRLYERERMDLNSTSYYQKGQLEEDDEHIYVDHSYDRTLNITNDSGD